MTDILLPVTETLGEIDTRLPELIQYLNDNQYTLHEDYYWELNDRLLS